MSNPLQPHGLHRNRLPCPSLSPGVCSDFTSILSNHLILCQPLLLLPSIFLSIRAFSHQVARVLELQLQQYPSNEYSGLFSFRMDWFDLLAVQGGFKSLLQERNSKASILWHCAFLKFILFFFPALILRRVLDYHIVCFFLH